MKTGSCGTFVISWTQTEIEGEVAAPLDFLRVGVTWIWRGEALRIDGPRDLLILRGATGEAELRARARRALARLIGGPVAGDVPPCEADAGPGLSFAVTDGYALWRVAVIDSPRGRLLGFSGRIPPAGTELWVTSLDHPIRVAPEREAAGAGVICFAAGTRIDTPRGPRAVETLRPGDLVQTRDDGAQPLLWVGQRRISAARLIAEPALRPIRIRQGACGIGRPTEDLLVSPGHRMLVGGRAARALFNSDEVLVTARDLIDGGAVRVAHDLTGLCYIHLMFARHQILRANGMDSESFHPLAADMEAIEPMQRLALLRALPGIADNPAAYGDFARRCLTPGEAALWRHDRAA